MAPNLIRRITGTNNTQQGAVETPQGLTAEMGSSIGFRLPEMVPQLSSRFQQLQAYDQMLRTDSVTSVGLRAAKAPILGADYYFEPASDEQQDADISEFISFTVRNALSQPFLATLGKICRNFQDGTSIFETVFEERDWRPTRKGANTKQYTMLKKLAYRPTITIQEIDTDDNGGPVQIIQNAIDSKGNTKEVKIPIEKAIVFPIGDVDDLFGLSLLRSAYPHWYYKNYLYKIDAIQKERHGIGIPAGSLPPGYKDKDRDLLVQMVRNLRTNEKAEVVLPEGYEIKFLKPEGNLVDVLKSAGTHDVLILLNFMAEFMMLGLESSGSGGGRATGAAQLDIFYKSSWYLANLICDSFNTYLIPKLVTYNFDTDQYPLMQVRNIGQTRDLQQLAAALANVTDKELIVPDDSTENWVRDIFDMPRRTAPRPEFSPTQVREIINQSTVVNKNNGQNTPVGSNGNVSVTGVKGGGNNGKAPTEA